MGVHARQRDAPPGAFGIVHSAKFSGLRRGPVEVMSMFEGLSEKLSGIFDQLTRRGALSEADVDTAMREVRRALLEADVSLDVVRSFVDQVKKHAVGIAVIK